MSSPSDDPAPRIRVGLRLSDFASTRSVIAGHCCCCCCCCLHWVGGIIGGAAGFVLVNKTEELRPATDSQQAVRRWISACAWLGLAALIVAGTVAWFAWEGQQTTTRQMLALLLLGLPAFAPAVVFLYVGLFMLLPALLGWRGDDGRYARRLSWRRTWTAFVYGTLGSVIGYLVMGALLLFF